MKCFFPVRGSHISAKIQLAPNTLSLLNKVLSLLSSPSLGRHDPTELLLEIVLWTPSGFLRALWQAEPVIHQVFADLHKVTSKSEQTFLPCFKGLCFGSQDLKP